MKFRVLLAVIAVLLALPVTAFAAEGETASSTYVTVESPDVPTLVHDLLSGDDESRSAFISALESIFGEYQPKTYSVTTYFPDGSSVTSVEVVPGLAGLDYAWIAGVGLFALFLFCLLKLIGGVVK